MAADRTQPAKPKRLTRSQISLSSFWRRFGIDQLAAPFIGRCSFLSESQATAMTLRLFLCVSFVIVALGFYYWACRIFIRGDGAPDHNAGPAVFFFGVGSLCLMLVGMMALGPWRYIEKGIFSMPVVDLSAQPAAIERVEGESPPPFATPAPESDSADTAPSSQPDN